MIVDALKEQLKLLEPDLIIIRSFWKNSNLEKEYQSLTAISQEELFWQNPDQAAIARKLQRIRELRDSYLQVVTTYQELSEFVELFAHDDGELSKLIPDLGRLRKAIVLLKIALLLNKPHDRAFCFVSINAGAGGTESQDWAQILLRMYIRFSEQQALNVDIIDIQQGEEAGIKSATLYIQGTNAYGLLKCEQGVHRLVRISPYDANKRRHTSFAAVHVLPEETDTAITINPNDLRIDTYRSGGAGGQHVNKTESAVRITHIPTNTVVQCQSERSQIQNRATAMKMLLAKLAQRAEEEKEAQRASVEKKKIEWGSQIRSYILHPYKMVKDHRTEHESPQPDLVLDGQLMDFIETYLIQQSHTLS
jgi:peptide chain release factor 2